MPDIPMLLDIVRALYAQVPWLFWGAAIGIGTFLWLYLCALVNGAWRLCTSADERAWFRFLREARRERYLEEARQRGELHPLWTRGDGAYLLGLLALAGVVMVLCR